MSIITESSLSDSVIFQSMNRQSELVSMINACIKNSIVIEPSHIEEQLMQIRRTHLSPLVDNVLSQYENGNIVLLHSKIAKVPQAIPFTVVKVQGGIKTFVFTNNYGSFVKNEKGGGQQYLNIGMKDLYVLMEGAYTALSYSKYSAGLTKNLGLMKLCSTIYTSMIMRILNKEYALSVDPELYNRTSFCVSKFFLERIWGSTNDDINTTYAMSSIIGANRADLNIVSDSYLHASVNTIEDLIAFLKTLSPRLSTLNMRYFTQCYLNTYKASALFSMECLPYFLYVVETALLGSFLVNQPVITDILKGIKGMNTFYAELSKVL